MYYNWHIKRTFQSSYLPGLIPEVTHVHEYKEGVDDFSVFDISACYVQPKQVERVVFSLPGIVISLWYFTGEVTNSLNSYPYLLFRNIIRFQRFCYMNKFYENPSTHICMYERIHTCTFYMHVCGL